ncbi:MAG: hypothetical protein RLZZ299_273 [Pseudomonadota bacterium]|jgi:hypothetical protein
MFPLLLSLALACADSDPCAAKAGTDRDLCLRAAVLAEPDAPRAHAVLLTVEDPLVRGLTAMDWVSRNRKRVTQAQLLVMCETLPPGEDERACVRHATAAHLLR